MNLTSVTTNVGAVGALAFLSMAGIAPAWAADSVQVRGTIVSLDGSTLERYATGLNRMGLCESGGL